MADTEMKKDCKSNSLTAQGRQKEKREIESFNGVIVYRLSGNMRKNVHFKARHRCLSGVSTSLTLSLHISPKYAI